MERDDYIPRLYEAIENYYTYNPDTLMPLIMLALAGQGKLSIANDAKDQQIILASVNPEEIKNCDWVRFDPMLKKRIEETIDNGNKSIAVIGELETSLTDIYNTFLHYDTYTVDEEYHHRIGILYHHSRNRDIDKAHRQYATICLAEAMIASPVELIQFGYLQIANRILVKSGLQPERPRLEVACALNALLDYDGRGEIYNPFAGCGITAAILEGGDKLWADGNSNDKLFAAARILNYGMGGNNKHFEQHDSKLWRDRKFDYIVSTYMGYIKGKSAFDFCLSKCFEGLNENGRFAGMISPKELFENRSEEMKEAMNRDWLDTVVLLPFGEAAVLINTNKDKRSKNKVRFINMNHPMIKRKSINKIIRREAYSEFFRLSEVKKKKFFSNLLMHKLPQKEGYEIVRLGDYIKKCRRWTYSLTHVTEDEKVLTFFNPKERYTRYQHPWMNGLEKRRIASLFAPAYHLDEDCLITNTKGGLEPRIYDADFGTSYFQDGYAFKFKNSNDITWIIDELREPYINAQLHPYGLDPMLPEEFSDEQILNLQIYHEIEEYVPGKSNIEKDALPNGYVINYGNFEYRILDFIGHGFFGFTYNAEARDNTTGDQGIIVLKEFYPHKIYRREGLKAVLKEEWRSDFLEENLLKFIKEAEIMNKLGNIEDSHIVPASLTFLNEETGTHFYTMPRYEMSLDDMMESGNEFSENLCLEHILKPICKALHIAHSEGILHLDIKPDNIMLDREGNAALIDFGVARQYDEHGKIINEAGTKSASMFAAPELTEGNMVRFGPQPDIYGLAATVYYLVTKGYEEVHPVVEFSDQDEDLRKNMLDYECSEQFIDAIVTGLSSSAACRPKNALSFLRLFPGCENTEF